MKKHNNGTQNPRGRRQLPPLEEREYLTLTETADRIGIRPATLRAWLRADELNRGTPGYVRRAPEHYCPGGSRIILFKKTKVAEYLERCAA